MEVWREKETSNVVFSIELCKCFGFRSSYCRYIHENDSFSISVKSLQTNNNVQCVQWWSRTRLHGKGNFYVCVMANIPKCQLGFFWSLNFERFRRSFLIQSLDIDVWPFKQLLSVASVFKLEISTVFYYNGQAAGTILFELNGINKKSNTNCV